MSLWSPQLSAVRSAHNRLLASEGKYREKSDTLAVHYQQAIGEIRHLHASNQHTQQSQHRIRAEIAALAVEFKAMEVALLDKTQQQNDARAEMARREDERRRETDEREERWRRKRTEWKKRETELIREQAERERGIKEMLVRQAEEREDDVRRAEGKVNELESEIKELSAKHRDECRQKEEQLYEAREQIQSAATLSRSKQPPCAALSPATHAFVCCDLLVLRAEDCRPPLSGCSRTQSSSAGNHITQTARHYTSRQPVSRSTASNSQLICPCTCHSFRTECSRLDLEIHKLQESHTAELKEAQRMQQTVEAAAQQRQALAEREKQSIQQHAQQCEKQIQQMADSVAARDKQVKQLKADCRDSNERISHLQLQIAALKEAAERADKAHNKELQAMQNEMNGSVTFTGNRSTSDSTCWSHRSRYSLALCVCWVSAIGKSIHWLSAS